MKVNIKKLHPNAIIPEYAKPGDAGMDLYCTRRGWDDFGNIVYSIGISIAIPEGYMGLLFPRSSISKKDISLANSVGVVDSGYRGEVLLKFKNLENPQEPYKYTGGNIYEIGDRVGQIIILPYPKIEFTEVEELEKTERGKGGFGSTGT